MNRRILFLATLTFGATAGVVVAQPATPVAIREDFKPGYQYSVVCRVNIEGELVLPPEKGQAVRLPVTGKSVIKYDERVLELKGDAVDRTVRFYEQMEFERKAGKDEQRGSLRAQVRRLVILRQQQFEVPFSPDGPLLWEEIDMVRTDVFTPALAGLLPTGKVRTGDSWKADPVAVQELTDLEKITKGGLTCTLKLVTSDSFARIAFAGQIDGIGEDGPASHEIEGFLDFDLTNNRTSYLSMQGTHHMLDKDGKRTGGQIRGTFVMTRDGPRTGQISDAALKGKKLQPNDDNTQIWFVNPEVGLSFLYPRQWHIGGVNGAKRQVGLDEKRGSGLLITVDVPQNVPELKRLQKEANDDLAKQKAKVNKLDPARNVATGIDTFGMDVEIGGRRVYLQYFLVRQKVGYAVLTANLQHEALAPLQKDLDRVVKSLVISTPVK